MAAENPGRAILLPVAVALVGLVAIGVAEDLPVRHSVEHNLTDRSSSALRQAGVPFSAVRFVGRDGTVTVPSAAAGNKAIAVVQHVDGVRVVHVIIGTGTGGTPVIAAPSPSVSLTAVPTDGASAPTTGGPASAVPSSAPSATPSSAPSTAPSSAPGATPSASAAPSAPSASPSPSPSPSPSQSAATSVQKQLDALGELTFASGSATLSSHDRSIVKKAAAILKSHPGVDLTVAGNTDSSGPAAANLVLSRRRAHAVADALHADGVATGRMKVVGYGETKPKVPNNTAQHRAANRRVDIYVKDPTLG